MRNSGKSPCQQNTEVALNSGYRNELCNATPEEIVHLIGSGSSNAESELVRRYSRGTMMMLERRTKDIQRAEDVHQDTFRIVLERLRSSGIDDPSRVASFIHRTAVNVLIGNLRKETRRNTYADTDLVQRQADASSDQLRELIQQEKDAVVRSAILSLQNARDKEILYRFYVLQEEKSTICEALELTATHFDRVISRARKRLRQRVEGSVSNELGIGART